MRDFEPLWPGGPLFCQAEHFRLSTDCVLLADFVNTSSAAKGIDLGCASGAIGLLLLSRSPRLHMTGLELLPQAAALAGENMEPHRPRRHKAAQAAFPLRQLWPGGGKPALFSPGQRRGLPG